MKILGIYGACWDVEKQWIHSAGASFWVDGSHKCTIEEERLSRIKHDGRWPWRSIEYVTEGEKPDIVVYVKSIHFDQFEEAIRKKIELEFPKTIYMFVDHHMAHVSAAVYTSGFEECSIFSLDGAGNGFKLDATASYDGEEFSLVENGMYGQFDKNGIRILYHSLMGIRDKPTFNMGQVYNTISQHIYSKMKPEEVKKIKNPFIFMETAPGKIMGLAGYGDRSKIKETLFYIVDFYFPAPIINPDIDIYDLIKKYKPEDVAAWLQNEFEEAYVMMFDNLPRKDNLCISGGCGLNVLANRRLIDEKLFDDVHVFPATNDEGLCFGGAMIAVDQHEDFRQIDDICYLGKTYSDEDIEDAIKMG